MKHISFAIVYIVIFGLSSSNFLDGHLQDTAYREIKRFFPLEWKRASNLGGRMCQMDSRNCEGFFVGKKLIGYSIFENNFSKMRKNNKFQRGMDSSDTVSFNSNNYPKWKY